MCDSTNEKTEDGRYDFGSEFNILSLSSWLCVLHLEARGRPQWNPSCPLV